MTLAQLEERLMTLEKVVEELRLQRTVSSPGEEVNENADIPSDSEDDLIPGVEYPFVVTVPPQKEWHIVAKIVAIDPAPVGLGLSDAEWAILDLEEDGDE